MTHIFIDSSIRIKRSSCIDELIPDIKTIFCHGNPKFYKIRAMGFSTREIAPKINIYAIENEFIVFPRGCLNTICKLLNDNNIEYQITDNRFKSNPISVSLKPTVENREYQTVVIKQLRKKSQQILVGPTGSGKTVVILRLLSELKQPTLIITQTSILFKQWLDEIDKYLQYDFNVGQIGNGVHKTGPITVAMMQTLMRMDEKEWNAINSYFGMIVNEECHHTPALENFKVMNHLKAHYRYGITATLKRKDQLEFLTYATMSKNIINIDENNPEVKNKRISPIAFFIDDKNVTLEGESYLDDKFEEVESLPLWVDMIEIITENERRNQHIIDEILLDLKQNHFVLVLTDRVAHCIALHKMFPNKKIAVPLIGNFKSAVKEKIKKNAKEGKIKVIFATRTLVGEGFDVPRLSSLHLVTPSNNSGMLQQLVGRVSRKMEGKDNAIVKDYVDTNSKYLVRMAKKRATYYKKMGVSLGGIDAISKKI